MGVGDSRGKCRVTLVRTQHTKGTQMFSQASVSGLDKKTLKVPPTLRFCGICKCSKLLGNKAFSDMEEREKEELLSSHWQALSEKG